jgi:hypothetical protein
MESCEYSSFRERGICSAILNRSRLLTGIACHIGGGASFPSSGSPKLRVNTVATANLTAEMWVKYTNDSAFYQGLYTSNGTNAFNFRSYNSAADIALYDDTGGSGDISSCTGSAIATGSPALSDGNWHHVAAFIRTQTFPYIKTESPSLTAPAPSLRFDASTAASVDSSTSRAIRGPAGWTKPACPTRLAPPTGSRPSTTARTRPPRFTPWAVKPPAAAEAAASPSP